MLHRVNRHNDLVQYAEILGGIEHNMYLKFGGHMTCTGRVICE